MGNFQNLHRITPANARKGEATIFGRDGSVRHASVAMRFGLASALIANQRRQLVTRRLGEATMTRAKYNAKPVEIDGIRFDSKAEANRYLELKLLERDGYISDLRVHPTYQLQDPFTHNGKRERAIYYEADFEYHENGLIVVEDVKGVEFPLFELKRKLLLFKHRCIDFRIVEAK